MNESKRPAQANEPAARGIPMNQAKRPASREARGGPSKPSTTRPKSLRKPIEADLGFAWGGLNSLLLGLGMVALVAGYVALARGSTTVAPLLLVLGYCGLIPASLLVRGRGGSGGE